MTFSILTAIAFALVAAEREPGLATQGTFLRLGFAALSVGVLLALESDEGEAAAAFPINLGYRLAARMTIVGVTWLIALLVVLAISRIQSTFIPRLLVEASVLNLAAILLGVVGSRTLIPQFTTGAALAHSTGFFVTLTLPTELNPWWNGYDPSVEPSMSWWYVVGIVSVLLTLLVVRRSYLWITQPGVMFPGLTRRIG